MLHSGQKWSKVNLKKKWPLCFEKEQARGLWWRFQLSSFKKDKISIFEVAQWSKMVTSQFEIMFDSGQTLWKSQFDKILTTVFKKSAGKGSVLKQDDVKQHDVKLYDMKRDYLKWDDVKWINGN